MTDLSESGDVPTMPHDSYTDMGGLGEAFLTTHWSLIGDVGPGSDEKDRALIGLLLERYWKPVYCYLRRRGYGNEQAKDLTQGFFHEVVLGRDLVQKADRTKGRFRSFLLIALNRHLINVEHERTAKKRMPTGGLVSLDMTDAPELPHPVAELTPEDIFTYAWVSSLLDQVLKEVKAACGQEGKGLHWHVFCDRVLYPAMQGGDAPSLGEICDRYGIADTVKASNMIVTVKRRFQTALKQHLRNSVMSDEEAEEELTEIRRFLPRMAQDGR
ncbi:MAG: sigma-70 family RNA polymerase sigma factor [Phycisphaerales bacterium]|nr:MAG: sigma-70 family RNA polymerase sigma factor [Phycisphaerales bacterium]